MQQPHNPVVKAASLAGLSDVETQALTREYENSLLDVGLMEERDFEELFGYQLPLRKRRRLMTIRQFIANGNTIDETTTMETIARAVESSYSRERTMGSRDLDRPPRQCSYLSKSEALKSLRDNNLVTFGSEFFFPLLPQTVDTTAFSRTAPPADQQENKQHHPYFLKELKTLVDDALLQGVVIRQQVLWTKDGKWLKLDDSVSPGVEPDFSTVEHTDANVPLVTNPDEGTKTPSSKYEVSTAFVQKKGFTEVDQVEAIDYGERLLCVQRNRQIAYTALFHCSGSGKMIRWFMVEKRASSYFVTVSRPASLCPGQAGQRQLLKVLSMTSSELGLTVPTVETNYGSQILGRLLGEGAFSSVFAVFHNEEEKAIKVVRTGFSFMATQEAGCLQALNDAAVANIPRCDQVSPRALLFDEILFPISLMSTSKVSQLIDCLEQAHTAGYVHRDVRPENIMQDRSGNPMLIDWGCAVQDDQGEKGFAGTFRYASQEVLEAALSETRRRPMPKDDLHSLLRSTLSMRNPDTIQGPLASLEQGDFAGALEFWTNYISSHPIYAGLFQAAENYETNTLRQA